VGRCRMLKVFAICCKLLPSLMSPPDRCHVVCFLHFLFFCWPHNIFCFNFLNIFVIALHSIMHFLYPLVVICIDWKRDLWQRCRPPDDDVSRALMLMSRHQL
jgi:hypothetical protein